MLTLATSQLVLLSSLIAAAVPAAAPPAQVSAQLDALLEAKWQAEKLTPVPPADDAAFLRALSRSDRPSAVGRESASVPG